MSNAPHLRKGLKLFSLATMVLLSVGGTSISPRVSINILPHGILPGNNVGAPVHVASEVETCAPDPNEPNDLPVQATPWTNDDIANFHASNDIDWYRYYAGDGGWRRFEMGYYTPRISFPYLINVYHEATGELVASGDATQDDVMGSVFQYYNIQAVWRAIPGRYYLVKVSFPAQATGLHSCGNSMYSGWIRSGSYPAVGAFQLNGMVYHDDNWSGDWQVEELPIGGVTILLKKPGGEVIATQITNTSGAFTFTNLPPGLYVLEETDLSNHISTRSNKRAVELNQDAVVFFGDYALPGRTMAQFLPLYLREQ